MPAPVVPPPMGPRSSTSTLRPAFAHSTAQAAPTIPAPTTITSGAGLMSNSPTKRVGPVQQQNAFSIDEGASSNSRYHFTGRAVEPGERTFESAPDDAFLHPGLIFFQFPICSQAGQFGARARATRRAVVCFAWTQHKIKRISTRGSARTE